MNERIKELITATDDWCVQNLPANWTDDVDQYLPVWNEKFAELLVKECILIVKMGITRDGNNTEKYLRSMEHIRQIEKHFGVEG